MFHEGPECQDELLCSFLVFLAEGVPSVVLPRLIGILLARFLPGSLTRALVLDKKYAGSATVGLAKVRDCPCCALVGAEQTSHDCPHRSQNQAFGDLIFLHDPQSHPCFAHSKPLQLAPFSRIPRPWSGARPRMVLMRFSRAGGKGAQPVRWRNHARRALDLCLLKARRRVGDAVAEDLKDPKDQYSDVAQGRGHTRGGPCRRCRWCKPERQHKGQEEVRPRRKEGPKQRWCTPAQGVQSTRCERPAASCSTKSQPAAMAPVGEGPEPTEVNRRGALQMQDPEPEPFISYIYIYVYI